MFRNKSLHALLATMAMTAIVSTALSAQTFTSNPNLAIPDSPNPGVSDSINVTGVTGAITSLRVDLRINHTWDSDLDIWLIPPGVTWAGPYRNGTPPAGVIDLCTDNGGNGDNFGTGATAPFTYARFSSATDPVLPGTLLATSGTAPFTAGVYIPEGSAAFNALYNSISPNGTWTLAIGDDAAGDTGTVLSWQLDIVGGGAGTPEIAVSRGATPVVDGGTDNAGSLVTSQATQLTYTISNSGLQNLTLTTPVAAPGAASNCTATIFTQPTTPVATGNTTTLVVEVTASASPWSFTLSIDNNDANENPFNFTVSGDATSPSLAIADNSPAAATIYQFATDVVVNRFTATSAAGTQTISDVAVAKTGTLADAQITAVKLWLDTNANGTLEPGTDTQLGTTQTFAAAAATFSGLSSAVTNPTVGRFLITFALTAAPTAGETFGCDVTSVTSAPGPVSGTPTTGTVHTVGGYFSALPFLDDYEPATTIFNRSTQISGTFPSGGTPPTTVTYAIQSQIQFGAVAASGVTPTSGTNQAGIDFPGGQSAGAIDYAFDLSAYNANTDTLILDFNWAETGDESTPQDGVYMSLDGGATWALQLFQLWGGTAVHQNIVVNVSAALVTATLNYTNQVVIRFQADDNFAFNTDGHVFDDIQLYELAEMEVLRGATPVADGGTDTGVTILSTGSNLTYTIQNVGGRDLNLTGGTLVVVTAGTNVTTVTVTTDPTTPVAGGGNTTFVINVVPTTASAGGDAYDFTVSIDNNDSDENPYNFTVSGVAISNLPPVVTVGAGNWVDAGGGLFTLTLNPGAAINDTLTVTDPTPDNMTVDVVVTPAFAGLTSQPVDIVTATAGPLSLTWVGTAAGSNTPGSFDWDIDINDGITTVSITARIIINDVAPQHVAATGVSGDGSVGTPYLANYAQNDAATVTTNLANVTDGNTGQTLNLTNVAQSSGPTTGSGFTFSLVGGVLSVAPSATLNANDVGTQVFSMDIDDGTNTVTVNVSITVLGNSGAITFTTTSPLAGGTVGDAYGPVTIVVAGATGATTFSILTGSLPAGLTMSTAGVISGTPTTVGTSNFTIRVIDSLNDSATQAYAITITSGGGGGGGGGGSDDDGGCSASGGSSSQWLALLGLVGIAAMILRVRRSRA